MLLPNQLWQKINATGQSVSVKVMVATGSWRFNWFKLSNCFWPDMTFSNYSNGQVSDFIVFSIYKLPKRLHFFREFLCWKPLSFMCVVFKVVVICSSRISKVMMWWMAGVVTVLLIPYITKNTFKYNQFKVAELLFLYVFFPHVARLNLLVWKLDTMHTNNWGRSGRKTTGCWFYSENADRIRDKRQSQRDLHLSNGQILNPN